MFVIFEEGNKSGPNEDVNSIEVVLDVVADLHQAGGHARARPVGSESAGVCECAEN